MNFSQITTFSAKLHGSVRTESSGFGTIGADPIGRPNVLRQEEALPMKTVVDVFCPHIGPGRARRAAGIRTGWPAMKPVQEPDAAHRRIRFDVVTSIWFGAMVGCIGAVVMPPFPESRS
jgi:hypothetical protein